MGGIAGEKGAPSAGEMTAAPDRNARFLELFDGERIGVGVAPRPFAGGGLLDEREDLGGERVYYAGGSGTAAEVREMLESQRAGMGILSGGARRSRRTRRRHRTMRSRVRRARAGRKPLVNFRFSGKIRLSRRQRY